MPGAVLGIVIALLVLQSVHLGTSHIAGQSIVGLVLVYGIPCLVILLFTLQLLQQRQAPIGLPAQLAFGR